MNKPTSDSKVLIPQKYLEKFGRELRFKEPPKPGIWPVDLKMIQQGLLNDLIQDKEFNEQFEIIIMPRAL